MKRSTRDTSQSTHVDDVHQQADVIEAALRARVTQQQNIGMIAESTASACDGAREMQADVVMTESERLEVLENIYDDHSGAVYAFCSMVFGSAAADEVTRQVFIAAFRELGPLDVDGEALRLRLILDALNYVVESPRCSDRRPLARSQMRLGRAFPWPGQRPEAIPRPANDLDRILGDSVIDISERTVLALLLIARCSYRDVGLITGQSESAVLQHARSALTRLSLYRDSSGAL